MKVISCRLSLAWLMIICLSSPLTATDEPAFDVASVKPNKSTTATVPESFSTTPSQFTATNMTLRNLITLAYRIQASRLVDAPEWLSDRFDVAAKIPTDAPAGQLGVMLQALLADRFKWKAHYETREQAIYALVTPRGTLGPAVQPSTA